MGAAFPCLVSRALLVVVKLIEIVLLATIDPEAVAGDRGAIVCALKCRFPPILTVVLVCDFHLGEGRLLPVTVEVVETGETFNTRLNCSDLVRIGDHCENSYCDY